MNSRVEALVSRGRLSEAARLLEREQQYTRAVELYGQAGEHAEAGRLLFTLQRYDAAAVALLKAVPDAVRRGGRPDEAARKAMRSAAVAYGRAVKPGPAAALFVRLGEPQRAADVLRRAGRNEEAEQVLAGGAPTEDPLMAAGAAVSELSGLSTRSPQERLALLKATRYPDPMYPRSAREAARIAGEHDLLDFELDNWLGPWLRADLPGQGPEDVEAMLSLAAVYERRDLVENAEVALQAALTLDPTRTTARERLRRLGRAPEDTEARLQAILKEDRAFLEAGSLVRPSLFAEPGSLPPLPGLPTPPVLSRPRRPRVGEAPDAQAPPAAQESVPDWEKAIREAQVAPGEPPVSEMDTSTDAFRTSDYDYVVEIDSASDARPSGDAHSPTDAWQAPGQEETAVLSTIDPRNLRSGQVVAERYRIRARLGKGGMGVVFRVEDELLHEEVALKIVYAPDADEADIARFKHEMRICRHMSHPNLVRVFEFGVWQGSHFLTMELLEGKDLDRMMKAHNGPLPLSTVLPLLVQACDGLATAHKNDVIHRDIKPGNLFVTDDGRRVKLMDFGIAKAHQFEVSVTLTGMLVGTPAYIAPERLLDEGADTPQSDLYALGVVMYELTTGRLPFNTREMAKLFVAHVNERPVPPHRRNPLIPEAMSDVVMKLLEKKPQDRHQSCAELRRALETVWAQVLRVG